MKTLIKNIGQIAGIVEEGVLRKEGAAMSETGTLDSAWLLIDNERIADFGPMDALHSDEGCEIIDAEGGMVLPAFCDSHTHIVFAGTREQEFLDKIEGLSYAEIAAHGGGILNSADLLHRTSEEELYRQAMSRVNEMISKGTGAIEIKSGYGLTPEDELKILRVIRRIRETSPAIIRATFLGAHAVGRAFAGRQEEYVDHVCKEMIPAVAKENLADFIDVFCEDGFFTPEQTDRILSEGERFGMRVKLHANQLAVSGGVQIGVRHNALSVDHLESTTDAEITALKGQKTMATMLPGGIFLPPHAVRPCPRFHQCRSGHSPGIGLQSRLISMRRHEDHHVPRLHPDAPHPCPIAQCLHAQFRLRHGGQRHSRLHHTGKAGKSHHHQKDSVPHMDSILLADAIYQQGTSAGTGGLEFERNAKRHSVAVQPGRC